MAANRHGISPDLVIHPGETIADILEDRNLTQKELAKRAGVSEPFLSDVICGKKGISKKLAMGLEYALGVPSSFWLNLQANYDAELLILGAEDTILEEERTVFGTIREIVDELKRLAHIPSDLTPDQTIIQLRKYFRVSSLLGLRELAPTGAFRMSASATVNQDVLGAWLCLCKVQRRCVSESFDVARVGQLVDEIKAIMCNETCDLQKNLIDLFSRYGIDFSILHSFRGAPVHGYIDRREDGTYQMVMTIRGSFADIFWFSVFHELGHIVNGDLIRPGSFIDANESGDQEKEDAADRFASEALLDPSSYATFVQNGEYTISSIANFAQSQNVPPYVVIGRLQKEKKIPWSKFSQYKIRYKWAE